MSKQLEVVTRKGYNAWFDHTVCTQNPVLVTSLESDYDWAATYLDKINAYKQEGVCEGTGHESQILYNPAVSEDMVFECVKGFEELASFGVKEFLNLHSARRVLDSVDLDIVVKAPKPYLANSTFLFEEYVRGRHVSQDYIDSILNPELERIDFTERLEEEANNLLEDFPSLSFSPYLFQESKNVLLARDSFYLVDPGMFFVSKHI